MEIALLNGTEQLLTRIAKMLLCPYGKVTDYLSAASLATAVKLQSVDLICLTDDLAAERLVLEAMMPGCPIVWLGDAVELKPSEVVQWRWPLGPEQVCAKLAALELHCAVPVAGLDVAVVEKLVRAMGNDAEFVIEEIDRYFVALPQQLQEIGRRTRQQQSEKVHQLTSISAMYGLHGLAALFLQLEYVLRSEREVTYGEWQELLGREMERSRERWLTMRGELSGNGPD